VPWLPAVAVLLLKLSRSTDSIRMRGPSEEDKVREDGVACFDGQIESASGSQHPYVGREVGAAHNRGGPFVEPRHQRCAIPVNQAFPAARYSCGEIRNSPMIWEIAKKRGAG
jgi:hypothetical protein